jgi:enoyl-CoA hydratase/carnithine racemase
VSQCTEAISVTRLKTTAWVTIGRGERHNCLDVAAWQQLASAAGHIADDPGVRVVVVTGQGDSFCAGSDIREWVSASPSEVDASFTEMEHAVRAVESIPVPVVASIRGVAAGAGLQVALGCDLRIAADDARLGMPVARLGILTPPPFAQRLIDVVGRATAREMLLRNRLLPAEEAWQRGLITLVVPARKMADTIDGLLAALLELPGDALRWAKEITRENLGPASTIGATAVGTMFGSAVDSFVDRRVG